MIYSPYHRLSNPIAPALTVSASEGQFFFPTASLLDEAVISQTVALREYQLPILYWYFYSPAYSYRKAIHRAQKAGTQVSVFLFSTRANCFREAAKGGNRHSSRSISSEASVN